MWTWLGNLGSEPWGPALLLVVDAVAKGLVLLALTGLATVCLRRASASARHLVWALALAGLLVLPVLSVAVPKWRLAILPSETAPAGETASSADAAMEVAPAPASSVASQTPATHLPPAPVLRPRAAVEDGGTPPPARRPLAPWLLVTWALGAFIVLTPLAGGWLSVLRLTRRSRAVQDAPLRALTQTLCRDLGIRPFVRLLEAGPGTMPMAAGVLRPAVFLPPEAADWPEDKLRAVLLHELGHVKRRDCLTHALGRAALALHWANPLAWLALRRLRVERERACDDLVLTAGERPSDYADHLLDIVRTTHARRLTASAAITMARKGQFEGRLLAVLDHARNRRGVTLRLAAAALAVACVLTLAVGTAHVVRGAEARSGAYEKAVASEDGRVAVDGRTFELQSVRRMDAQEALDVLAFPVWPYDVPHSARFAAIREGAWDCLLIDIGGERVFPKDFDVVAIRVFDHASRDIVWDSEWRDDRFAGGFCAALNNAVFLARRGDPWPETIDLWFRVVLLKDGPRTHMTLPANGDYVIGSSGNVTVDEARAGSWSQSYSESGGEVMWKQMNPGTEESACTIVLRRKGDWADGRLTVCAVDKQGNKHWPGSIHFLDFERAALASVTFPLPLVNVRELSFLQVDDPEDFRKTFYFDGVGLPDKGQVASAAVPDIPQYLRGAWHADGQNVGIRSNVFNLSLELHFKDNGVISGTLGGVSLKDIAFGRWSMLDRLRHSERFDHKIEAQVNGTLSGTRYDGPVIIGLIDNSDHWLARPYLSLDTLTAGSGWAGLTHYMMEPADTAAATEPPETSAESAEDPADQFTVSGIVTDDNGRPMEGVTVRASTGWATLLGGGSTETGSDGRYTLNFGPGMRMQNAPNGIGFQVAYIHAHKSHWIEKNLNRHGDWRMAGSRDAAVEYLAENPEEADHILVLPGKRRVLDFIMTPAATIHGRLLDSAGQPVGGQYLWLDAEELPPASSALDSTETDAQGAFVFDSVPTTQPVWLGLTHERKDLIAPVQLEGTGDYIAELAYDRSAGDLNLRSLVKNGPAAAEPSEPAPAAAGPAQAMDLDDGSVGRLGQLDRPESEYELTWAIGGSVVDLLPESAALLLPLPGVDSLEEAAEAAREQREALHATTQESIDTTECRFFAVVTSGGKLVVVDGVHVAKAGPRWMLAERNTAPENAEATAPEFGPIRNAVVGDDNANDMFIDFDTGRQFTPPEDLDNTDSKAVDAWIEANGVDALGETSTSIRGLVGFDMIVIPVASPIWEQPSPQAANEQLDWGKPGTPSVMSGKGELPAVYYFQTREDGRGILRIVELIDTPPRGVRIEYRMLNAGPPAPADVKEAAQPASPVTVNLEKLQQTAVTLCGKMRAELALGDSAITGRDFVRVERVTNLLPPAPKYTDDRAVYVVQVEEQAEWYHASANYLLVLQPDGDDFRPLFAYAGGFNETGLAFELLDVDNLVPYTMDDGSPVYTRSMCLLVRDDTHGNGYSQERTLLFRCDRDGAFTNVFDQVTMFSVGRGTTDWTSELAVGERTGNIRDLVLKTTWTIGPDEKVFETTSTFRWKDGRYVGKQDVPEEAELPDFLSQPGKDFPGLAAGAAPVKLP